MNRLNSRIKLLFDTVKNINARHENNIGTLDPADATKNCGPELNFNSFISRFGGSEALIKGQYIKFIPHYENAKNMIDIGCGRGFFLDLACDHSITVTGIDTSADAVDVCVKRGRYAIQSDALSYVESLRDESIDGIFMAHVIEHMDHAYIAKLIKAFSKKLIRGSSVVIITPNITNVIVSASLFYIDPTHVTHIHPDYIDYLLSDNGFEVASREYYQPIVPESMKLEKLDSDPDTPMSTAISRLNNNMEKLNEIIFGNWDFAIIAKKL